MKLEQFCPIFEQSTCLVNSQRVVKKHIKHQEDDDGESGGCHRRSNGEVH